MGDNATYLLQVQFIVSPLQVSLRIPEETNFQSEIKDHEQLFISQS